VQKKAKTREADSFRNMKIKISYKSKLENKLVVSLSCRLGIARDTKVSIKKKHLKMAM
jgi:hypothetical protein